MPPPETKDIPTRATVVVVDCGDDDEPRLEALANAVPTRVFRGAPTASELVHRATDAEVLVVLYTYTNVTAEVLGQLPNLKLVATRTAGHTHIDVEAAARSAISVATVPSATTPSVAEYVFGALIASQRGLLDARESTRDGAWDYQAFRGFELAGSVLGVVGLGAIGTRVAELGNAFGMRVIGWSRSGRPVENVEPVAIDELLRRADVVSLNVALTDETEGLIGKRELTLMKPTAWLVNAARGGIVDEDALARQLREGLLGGAILDVVDPEPPPAKRLAELATVPNLLVTPHIAWHTEASLKRQFDETTENVLAFLRGEQRNLITLAEDEDTP